MSLYELTTDEIRPISQTTFREANIQERGDLQRLLRERIEVIAPGCLVIAEEFGEWDESRRRIDLLAIDTDANLVVIELKRTEDGGHMELQAVRYASMVSTMTFEQAVRAYAKFLESLGKQAEDAERKILGHLSWGSVQEEKFAQDVRIILASAEFSKELTSAVLWLNDSGLDICCMRMSPHNDGGRVLLDVQQVIPLPEAEGRQIRVREKTRRERESRRTGGNRTKYVVSLSGEEMGPMSKREAVFRVVKHLCDSGVAPKEVVEAVTFRKKNCLKSVPGTYDTNDAFVDAAVEDARTRGRVFDSLRWYTDTADRIEHAGCTWVVSNQWGGRAIEWLSELVEAFPTHGIKFWADEEQ